MDVYIFYILVISECFDGLRNHGDKYVHGMYDRCLTFIELMHFFRHATFNF